MTQSQERQNPKGEHSENRSDPEAPVFRVIDRRHFLQADAEAFPAPEPERPRYPSFVEELLARMKEMEKRFEEKKQQIDEEIQRARERLESDSRRELERERQKILLPFLEVLDNLERAMAAAQSSSRHDSLLDGVRMIASQLRACLQAQGVEPIELLDSAFDPNLGEAVGIIAVDDPRQDGLVLDEVRTGYRMGEQLMRPAQVRVGRLKQEHPP